MSLAASAPLSRPDRSPPPPPGGVSKQALETKTSHKDEARRREHGGGVYTSTDKEKVRAGDDYSATVFRQADARLQKELEKYHRAAASGGEDRERVAGGASERDGRCGEMSLW